MAESICFPLRHTRTQRYLEEGFFFRQALHIVFFWADTQGENLKNEREEEGTARRVFCASLWFVKHPSFLPFFSLILLTTNMMCKILVVWSFLTRLRLLKTKWKILSEMPAFEFLCNSITLVRLPHLLGSVAHSQTDSWPFDVKSLQLWQLLVYMFS